MSQQAAGDAGATIFDTTATTVRTDSGETLTASGAVYAFDPANSNLQNCCGAAWWPPDTAGKERATFRASTSPASCRCSSFGAPQVTCSTSTTPSLGPATAKYAGEESQ